MKLVTDGDVNQHIKRCTWVTAPAQPGMDAIYCNAPVGYTMRLDEDGSRVRSYNHLCAKHEEVNKGINAQIRLGIADGTLDADDYLYDLD